MTPIERNFAAVTQAMVRRLMDAAGNAGCNDVCSDEFPTEIVKAYRSDLALIEDWQKLLPAALPSEPESQREKAPDPPIMHAWIGCHRKSCQTCHAYQCDRPYDRAAHASSSEEGR